METSFRYGLLLISGLLLLVGAAFASALIVNSSLLAMGLLFTGLGLSAYAVWHLRDEVALLVRGQRGELVMLTLGLLILFAAIAWVASL